MKKTLLKVVTLLCGSALFGSAQAATIYVPAFGSTGLQTFSYIFGAAFSGDVIIGVSDQQDTFNTSFLSLPDYPITLDTDMGHDTSVYQNTLGEYGVHGGLYSFALSAAAGDVLSFDWAFSTQDYSPYNDFSFVAIGGIYYSVLAEIDVNGYPPQTVPIPATAWLFGSGLLGLLGAVRRESIK